MSADIKHLQEEIQEVGIVFPGNRPLVDQKVLLKCKKGKLGLDSPEGQELVSRYAAQNPVSPQSLGDRLS